MKLPDANVLVYASNTGAPQHAVAATWLRDTLAGQRALALAWVAMLGFLRVSTRAGIFAKPLPVAVALRQLHALMAAPGSTVVQPGPRHAQLLSSLLLAAGSAGNLTTDAHLAAIAIEQGATLVSFDRDFKRFDGLALESLA